MTILNKIDNLLQGKTGLKVITFRSAELESFKEVKEIVYSAISLYIRIKIEGNEQYVSIKDLYFKDIQITDEFTTKITRNDTTEYPDKNMSRYSPFGTYDDESYDLAHSEYRDDVNKEKRCIYCGRKVTEIYTDTGNHGRYRELVGYTCLCLNSELKKELEYKVSKIEKRFNKEKSILEKSYNITADNSIFIEKEIEYYEKKIKNLKEMSNG